MAMNLSLTMFATILREFRQQATLAVAQLLLENVSDEAFVANTVAGYRIAECCSDYAGVKQRWLVVESQARTEADLKQLEKRLAKQLSKAQSELRQLSQQEFACAADAMKAARRSLESTAVSSTC